MRKISLEPPSSRFKPLPPLVVHEPGLAAARRQAQVGVVDAQQQAMLRTRREHAIRLETTLRDQVVDQNADIRLVTPQLEPFADLDATRAALMPATMPCAAASS